MIRILTLLCAALVWTTSLVSPTWAQSKDKHEPSEKQLAQRERMKSCNAQAAKKEMKAEERKAFMSNCLKADSGDLTAQQQRMVSCNQQASRKALKGEERRDFMSECLRGEGAAAGGSGLTSQQQRMKTCNTQAEKRELKGEKRRDFMSECLRS